MSVTGTFRIGCLRRNGGDKRAERDGAHQYAREWRHVSSSRIVLDSWAFARAARSAARAEFGSGAESGQVV
jgi:hypothetical protein